MGEAAPHLDIVEGWMDLDELAWLRERANATRGQIVEVGSYLGRSTCAILAGIADPSQLVCVDTWDGRGTSAPVADQLQRFLANIAERGHGRPRIFEGESVAAAQQFAPGSVAWVFLDASHDYESVKADIAAWTPKVHDAGFICGHDYGTDWPGVTQAVDEAFGERVRRVVGSIWEVRL